MFEKHKMKKSISISSLNCAENSNLYQYLKCIESISILLTAIFFPWVKIPVFIFTLMTFRYIERVPEERKGIVKVLYDYYFWAHFLVIISISNPNNFEWFTLFSIIYNLYIYQIVLISQFRNKVLAVCVVSIFQFLDGIPIFFSMIDNITALYTPPLCFLPEKLVLYGFVRFCLVK